MLKSFLKFLLMSFVTFVALIVAIVAIAAFTMGPKVGENAVLVLELSGPLVEQGAQSWKERLLIGEMLTLHQIDRALEKAVTDKRIKALLVHSLYAEIGFGKAQEIRSAIKDFARQSKKPVLGFLEDGGTIDYYICSAAPKVYMPPDSQSWFTLLGLRAEVPFFKGTLDKLGIVAQLDHVGIYKSGSDIYTRSDMSDADRLAVNSLLDSLFHRITEDIAKDRRLSQAQMISFINQAPLLGNDYKKDGLIDDFLYLDQIENQIKKETKVKDFDSISALDYSKPTFREAIAEADTKIGIVYAAGTIMPGKSSRGWGESVVGSASITQALKQAREDKTVKAIVLRIDSPGGSPSASDVIWREVKVTSAKKPVVVSMSDVAASGGYYIAMGASKILASPSTITGSIGVYGGKFYLKGLYDKIGLNKEIIKRGEHADLFSDYVPFSEEEWAIIRKHMMSTYDAFTRKAAEGRKKSQQQIHQIAQGRVWTGDQGVQIGLVDRTGGLKEAIEEAKKLAKITDKEVGFVEYPAPEGGLSDLFSSSQPDLFLQDDIKKLILWAQIAQQERTLLVMPYKVLTN